MKLKDFKGGLFAGGKKGPQPIAPKEASISKSIEEFLNAKRIYNDRLNSGQFERITTYTEKRTGQTKEYRRWFRGTRAGTPDRFAILPAKYDPHGFGGRILFIEVKTKSTELKPDQVERHAELEAAGAIVLVARSIDDVDLFLRAAEALSLKSRKRIQALDGELNGDMASTA